MLALAVNQVVPVDHLVDGLWGESPPERAVNAVQSYVSRLRRILSSGAEYDTVADLCTIRSRKPGYLLEMDRERIDVFRFERLVGEGRAASATAPEAASATLRDGLSLWRGPALVEFCDEPFAAPQIHRLGEQWLSAITARVETDLTLGRHTELIGELEVLVAAHPLHEGLRGQLMLSLFRSGRQADALAAFRDVQRTFAEELGIEPGRQLTELEAGILQRDPGLDWHPRAAPVATVHGPAPTASIDGGPGRPPDNGRSHKRVFRVPARNPHFTGRASLIAQLRDRFCVVQEGPAVQALYGLGGVGKTQVAIEYAHRFAAAYSIVWWIDAEQPALIPDQLITLSSRLGLPTHGNSSDVVDRLLTELAEQPTSLLIFDNSERPDDIAGYRPAGSGHLLVTSRYPGWGALGGRLQVDVMTRSETVTLLQARIPSMGTELSESLSAEMGDLPLAAAQAAAYLEQTGTPPDDYLRQFRTRRASLLAHGDVVGYQRRVDTAWDISLERLRAVSPASVELLELAAFMGPETIPLTIFSARPQLLSGALREAALAGEDVLADVVGAAVAFSLVNRHQQSFQLHRLVQAVIRHGLPPERQLAVGSQAIALLCAAHPGDPNDRATWPCFARLAPHVLAAGHLGDDEPDGRRLMLATLAYLNVRGDSRATRTIAEDLLDRWRRVLGDTHPATLQLASMLTSVLAWLGEAEQARALGQSTLDRCRDTFGPDDPTTLSAATYLTSALAWLGENDQARILGQDTLERCRTTLGPDHPTTLGSAAQWSFTLLGLGQVDLARSLSLDTAQRARRTLGTHHPTTLLAFAGLTFSLAWLGEATEAHPVGEETLERCGQAFGADHWLTLLASAALTFALVKMGENERARSMSDQAFRRSEQLFGPDHWVTLLAAAAFTLALGGLGEAQHARTLGQDARDRSGRTLGPQHPITVSLREQLDVIDGSGGRASAE